MEEDLKEPGEAVEVSSTVPEGVSSVDRSASEGGWSSRSSRLWVCGDLECSRDFFVYVVTVVFYFILFVFALWQIVVANEREIFLMTVSNIAGLFTPRPEMPKRAGNSNSLV